MASFTPRCWSTSLPGLVGMFCLINAAASAMSLSGVTHGAVLIVASLAIVGTGVGLSLYGPTDPTVPSEVRPPRRRLRAEILNTLCNVAVAPFAMGVFGMLGDLVDVGRNIF